MIAQDKNILSGKPRIKGTRISVDQVIKVINQGWSNLRIRQEFPNLKSRNIKECLEYSDKTIKQLA